MKSAYPDLTTLKSEETTCLASLRMKYKPTIRASAFALLVYRGHYGISWPNPGSYWRGNENNPLIVIYQWGSLRSSVPTEYGIRTGWLMPNSPRNIGIPITKLYCWCYRKLRSTNSSLFQSLDLLSIYERMPVRANSIALPSARVLTRLILLFTDMRWLVYCQQDAQSLTKKYGDRHWS